MSLQLLHQQPQPHPKPGPSPEYVHPKPSLVIIRCLMRGLEEGQEFHDSCPEGGLRAPQYDEIREDVTDHPGIKADPQALGYEYQW